MKSIINTAFPKPQTKDVATVYINGRFLTQPVTGVQRYALETLRQLDLLLNDDEIYSQLKLVCLVPQQEFLNPSWKNIEIRPIGKKRGNFWEQFELPQYINGKLLFSPTNIGPWHYSNQIVTLHDASVFAVPETYSFAFRAKYKFIFKQLVKRDTTLLTDSIFSQKELAHYLKVPPSRFKVVPLGSDHLESVQPNLNILKTNRLKPRSYLLIVASQSQHKNYHSAIRAVRSLRQDVTLVSVGGNFQRVFKKSDKIDIPSNVLNLGYVNDQELRALYENAMGFIAPSIYEGFGLPVLEAMRAGCPVISSNAASLPEIAGDATLYFNPHDVEDISRTIKQFITNSDIQEKLRHRGYLQADKFMWSTTAKKILEIMQKALAMM